MKAKRQNVGVDVSKGTLASCIVILNEDFEIKVKASKTFTNNAKGFCELHNWADIKKDSGEVLKMKTDKVTTIPGIGFITAIIIISETHGFALITSIKQLVPYAGLDIKIREPGKWGGKSRITKNGNVHIRKALYFPSYSSIKYSETNRVFYDRLFEKKGKSMIAATAVQRKLLGLIYTLWKNNTTYVENYQQGKAA